MNNNIVSVFKGVLLWGIASGYAQSVGNIEVFVLQDHLSSPLDQIGAYFKKTLGSEIDNNTFRDNLRQVVKSANFEAFAQEKLPEEFRKTLETMTVGDFIDLFNKLKALETQSIPLQNRKTESPVKRPIPVPAEDPEEMKRLAELKAQAAEEEKLEKERKSLEDFEKILEQQEKNLSILLNTGYSDQFIDQETRNTSVKDFENTVSTALGNSLERLNNFINTMPEETKTHAREETTTFQKKIRSALTEKVEIRKAKPLWKVRTSSPPPEYKSDDEQQSDSDDNL